MHSVFYFLSIITKCLYILVHFTESRLENETFYLVYFFLIANHFSHIDPFTQHLPCKCHDISKMR